MEFWRWGNLAPQKHKTDRKWFHTPPVECGIYAFPQGIVEWEILTGLGKGNIRNGRCSYVRDPNGRKVMMSYDDWDSIEYYVSNGPIKHIINDTPDGFLFLKGMDKLELALYAEIDGCRCWPNRADDDNEVDDALHPLVKVGRKPIKFEYKGNIWHHLETTYPYESFEKINRKYKRLVEVGDIIKKSGSWILTDMKTFQKAFKKAKNILKFDVMNKRKRESDVWNNHVRSSLKIPNNYFYWDEFEVFIEKV